MENRAEEGQPWGPTFAPASCPKADAGLGRVRPLRRPVSHLRRSWVFKGPGLIREQDPGPTSSSSILVTSIQTERGGS